MGRLSLFLDIDGTLLELAGHPDAVNVPDVLPQILQHLDDKLYGALALASGRNIAAIDRIFSPYRGAAIGVHGLEWRARNSAIEFHPLAVPAEALRREVAKVVRDYPGSFIEDKGCAIAVHERGDAAAADSLAQVLAELCAKLDGDWQCLPGHRVIEIKPGSVNKGTGLEVVMRRPPFAGTQPVVIGDDVTDLDMFAAALRFRGLTIAVGGRIADDGHLHLRSPVEVLRFLNRWSESNCDKSIAAVEDLARFAATA